MRTEMKIGLVLIAFAGIGKMFFNAPEFILGLAFSLGITFEIVGGLKQGAYEKLKQWKKSFLRANRA